MKHGLGKSRARARRALARVALCCGALAALLPCAQVARADESGRAILDHLRKLDRGERGWSDRTQRLMVEIIDRRGNERRRELVMRSRRAESGAEKTLTAFLAPEAVRGTALLQIEPRGGGDEQWLYLPELRRVRRISAAGKDESFMGSDFSHRDLELLRDVLDWGQADASARLVGSETIDGTPADRVEIAPQQEKGGYARIVVVVSRPDHLIRRLEMYDSKTGESPVKVLSLSRIESVHGVPTPRRMEMVQPRRGGRTIVEVNQIEYDQGLDDELFTQRALERIGEDPAG